MAAVSVQIFTILCFSYFSNVATVVLFSCVVLCFSLTNIDNVDNNV